MQALGIANEPSSCSMTTTPLRDLKPGQRTTALLQTALQVNRDRRGSWKC